MKLTLFCLLTIGLLGLASAASRFRVMPKMIDMSDEDPIESQTQPEEMAETVKPQWEITIGTPTKFRNLKTCWVSFWIVKVCTFVVPGEDVKISYRAL